PEEVNDSLYKLADSAHWEVREWVASACGQLLGAHFEEYCLVMSEWARDDSENIRRAVVLAVMYAARARQADRAEPLLDLLVPLLSDRSAYVMDNLGPFALGSALIRYYPATVLHRMRAWVLSDDEQVRWNVAMAFTTAAAVALTDEATPIWQALARDPHPYVQRAWKKAMRNIEERTHVRFSGEGML
ncbi:MAG: DNA alkylation repair protein, partial [Firmicutes bacterium]|nr:DNA alkylation repair protein [Bacillota bacterium]